MNNQKIELRYYQEDYITATFRYIKNGGKRGIAAIPTGLGKSVCIAELCKRILHKNSAIKIMMLTDRKELIAQNAEKLRTVWPTAPLGIYSAGLDRKQYGWPIVYGGIQSVWRRPKLFGKIDVLIIDEVQGVSDKSESMYFKFINHLLEVNPDLIILGLTATPYRLGMGLLTEGPIFNDIYYDISTLDDFVRLIDEGYLSDVVSFDMDSKFDLTNVKKIAGEFSEKSLDDNLNRDEITKAVVAETIERAKGRKKGLAFCVTVSHAENMARLFREAGLRCKAVHAGLSDTERDAIIEEFRNGELDIMTNVGIATVGLDVPDIDYIILARPSESTGLHVQMVGRGLRIFPGKVNCMVLDFAGNTLRLGPINDPIIPIKKGEKGGEAPSKVCEQCGAIQHAAAKECKECGFEFPPPVVKIAETAYAVDLIKRKDVPMFVDADVNSFTVNLHRAVSGNTSVKISYICSGGYFYDEYLTFNETQRKGFMETLKKMSRLKFKEEVPQFSNNSEAVEFFRKNMIQPKQIRVWLNKPVVGKKKKYKAIMDYDYEGKNEQS